METSVKAGSWLITLWLSHSRVRGALAWKAQQVAQPVLTSLHANDASWTISTRQWCGLVQCASVFSLCETWERDLGGSFSFSFLTNYFYVCWINIHCFADMITTQRLTGKLQEPVQQTSIPLFVSGGSLTKNKVRSKSNRVKQQNTVSRRDKV